MTLDLLQKSSLLAPPVDPACALIQLEGVTKIFKTGAGEFTALKDINLCFGESEFVAIMGKSGSGKSTLINMITGIDHPTSGSVRVGDVEVHRMREGELAVWRGKTLGIVFQFFQLLPMLTVLENTMLPMDFAGKYPPAERPARALALLEKVGLHDEADKLPAALSSGQQQVAAVARALANDPPLILADEPTGNLDSRSAERILAIFNELASQGKTILIVTHDPSLAQRATRQVLICDGELINPLIAQALPLLSHPQMLSASKGVARRSFQPGEDLPLAEGGLYILTSGSVQVLRLERRGAMQPITRLMPGDLASEYDLQAAASQSLIFRCEGQLPVETLWLSGALLHHMLLSAPAQEKALQKLAQSRYQPGDRRVARRGWLR